jgi:predicted TIM-barrel fold metal-dependent hydrolase
MIINTHCHLTTYKQDFSEAMGALYENNYRRKGELNWWTGKPWTAQDFCVTPEKLVADMDRAGVDKSVIMGYYMQTMGNIKPDLPEYISECVTKFPDRIIGFYTANPLGGLRTVREIENYVGRGSLSGVKIMPGYDAVAINDHRIWPIYEVTQELGVPIIIHTGHSSLPHAKSLTYNHPLFIEDLALAFPNLKIIAAHTGMHWPEDGLTVLLRYPNVYGDFAFWSTMPFFKIVETMVWAKKLGLFSKLLWGTDYPEYDFEPEIAMYKKVPDYSVRHELEPFVDQRDISAFLGANAAKLFGFSHSAATPG